MTMTITDIAVLIVEDEPVQRAFLCAQLKQFGVCRLHLAADGCQAIEILREHSIDLIFCDIGMPNMDGPQFVLQQLEARPMALVHPVLPMLVWTSAMGRSLLESHVRLARSAGFDQVEALAKPLSTAALQQIIAQACVSAKGGTQGAGESGNAMPDINEDDLLHAICDIDQFDVMYRPVLSLESMRMVGGEAVAHWNHPRFRGLCPERFITLIEQQGLGLVLLYRTVNHVLKVQQALRAQGLSMSMCIRASAQTLQSSDIADYLAERVRQHRLSPDGIAIVVTESAVPMRGVHLSASLNRLRIKGFGVHFNGFGPGDANLKMLAELPFDGLCIDASLVGQLRHRDTSLGLIEIIAGIGERLGLKLIANGVASKEIGNMLLGAGCTVGQGEIARPVTAAQFVRAALAGAACCF